MPSNILNDTNIYIKTGTNTYTEIEALSKFVQFLTETYTDIKLFYPEDFILQRAAGDPQIETYIAYLREMRD